MKRTKISIIFTILLLHATWLTGSPYPVVELKNGLVIRSSVQVKKANYRLNGYDSLNRSVILIEGNNITVDFNNSSLQGSFNKQLPNEFYGLAILVKGNNITIKNARVRGYKVAMMAEGCKNLRIEYCDLSYNYRQQLQSTWLREDVSDWMSYHHNEKDEWLRYGAGIYLKNCSNAVISNNTITGGQCALMMTRCTDGMITDNDFSFNSAIGIGMYRSNRNNILHNKLDFNVRGYSHGFYNRGQDSAGILVFEQCNNNVFAYNSATHGGDGFFLWAGQTTMDTGEGGCNDNFIFKNDFSYAPTNGVEVTFSKNKIFNNIIKECDHGIWGGYSWNTSIVGNLFYKNKTGIAIEHGQSNAIGSNKFDGNTRDGIRLWARKTQPSDWGYANKRITSSMQYRILNNEFANENNAINISMTDGVILDDNKFINCKKEVKTDSSVTNLEIDPTGLTDTTFEIPSIINKWKKTEIPVTGLPMGRQQMRITEWGPYNYRYPILFLKKIDSNQVYHFDVLGPKGRWKISNSKDVKHISLMEGSFPAEITAQQNGTDLQIKMEYSGEAFTDQFGRNQAANKIYHFSFRDFEPNINWTVKWYSWDAAHNPNKNYEAFRSVYNHVPVRSETAKKVDYTWWGAIGKNLPADSFAIVATGTVEVPGGLYEVNVTADDLVKVFIDGKPLIDFWDATKYKYDEDTHHRATIKLNGNTISVSSTWKTAAMPP